jgi:hypothetical protein
MELMKQCEGGRVRHRSLHQGSDPLFMTLENFDREANVRVFDGALPRPSRSQCNANRIGEAPMGPTSTSAILTEQAPLIASGRIGTSLGGRRPNAN